VPDIEPDDGDGPGGDGRGCRDGRGCHEGPEPLGWADQVTGTTCVSEPLPWKEMAALPPVPAPFGRAPGAAPGGSGWVAAVIMTWFLLPAVLTSGGGVASGVPARRLPDGARDAAGPAAPRPEGCSAGPLAGSAARVGVTPPAASGWPGPAAAMAGADELVEAGEEVQAARAAGAKEAEGGGPAATGAAGG
jgi:hypothetical protein